MKILVRNLSRKTTENDLMGLFSPYGTVAEISLVYDAETKRSKGFGFVEMPNGREGAEAIKRLNGQAVAGNRIRVKVAEGKGRHDG